jgi:hypothetical protein
LREVPRRRLPAGFRGVYSGNGADAMDAGLDEGFEVLRGGGQIEAGL